MLLSCLGVREEERADGVGAVPQVPGKSACEL